MALSDSIAQIIRDLLEASGGAADIKRNELAVSIGCVPSQINYVIASRFTPAHGYIVESRRGGGGYVRIRRIAFEKDIFMAHVINGIGDSIDINSAKAIISNLCEMELISSMTARIIYAAVDDKNFASVHDKRENLIAAVLKSTLITQII